jgi:hypothetical protein
MYLNDFLESVTHKYLGDKEQWNDISTSLRESVFASRVINRAGPEEMEGDLCEWKLQYAYADNFRVISPYSELESKRVDTITHGRAPWSCFDCNYNFSILEDKFRTTKVRLIDGLLELEHGLANSYVTGMEKQMLGNGPTTLPSAAAPIQPFSLLWWIQPYNGVTTYPAFNDPLGTGAAQTGGITLSVGPNSQSNGFLGMDPPGYSSVGTGGVFSSTVPGWRNRCGIYTSISPSDAIDTMLECIRKTQFKPLKAYPELTPGDRPDWEILTTYSVEKELQRLLQSGNDRLQQDVAQYKGRVVINGVPIQEVPAWSNQELGIAQTSGPIVGVNWKTWKYFFRSGLRMQRMPLIVHPTMPYVRVRLMVDSGQVVCLNRRSNWRIDSTIARIEYD